MFRNYIAKKNHQHKIKLLIVVALIGFVGAVGLKKFVYQETRFNLEKQKIAQNKKSKNLIELSPHILKNHPIQLSQLSKTAPAEDMTLPGYVQKDPTRVAHVTARAQGRITEVYVKEANPVRRDQVLAKLQSQDVAQAQTTHLKALIRLELASHHYDRSKDLYKHEIISAREYEVSTMEFKSAKAELKSSRIHLQQLGFLEPEIELIEKEQGHPGELNVRSPIDGWVIERKSTLGQSVFPEDTLFTVGKTDKVWIVLNIYEKDIPFIDEGMTAEVIVPRGNEHQQRIPAKVARISPVIDAATRSAKVWLEVNNANQDLKFGQSISAKIQGIHQDRMNHAVLVLPREAVHQIEGESIVFVKKGDFVFEPRKVKTGWTSDDWIEIKIGVNPGEKVAAAGSFNLKSEFLRR
jgi:cobalt-zinc-cadmium efflux system membrane fusion protein